MIKNVIFDWSGTLSDDFLPVYHANRIVFDTFGVKKLSFEEFKREFELPYMNFYRRYLPSVSKTEIDRIFPKAIHSVEEPTPYPQVREILEALSGEGIRMAVLSAMTQTKIDKEVGDYGFAEFFLSIKGGVNDKREEILKLMQECGFDKKETAYVGDATHDIDTGKVANVTTIAVCWGYQPKEKLLKANPDFVAENFEQLKELLLGKRKH